MEEKGLAFDGAMYHTHTHTRRDYLERMMGAVAGAQVSPNAKKIGAFSRRWFGHVCVSVCVSVRVPVKFGVWCARECTLRKGW